jgi:aminoglycoside N3'-acetyltransferase
MRTQIKAGLHFHAVRNSPGVARKNRPCASVKAYGPRAAEVSFEQKISEKNQQGIAAMQMLHCTIVTIHLYQGFGRTNKGA